MAIQNGKFSLLSRSEKKNMGRLGRKSASSPSSQKDDSKVHRRQDLYVNKKYVKNCQYDHLSDWDAKSFTGEPLKIKQRKPCIIYNLPKRISHQLASKLVGPRVFPSFTLDEDPLTKELVDLMVRITGLKMKVLDMARDLPVNGSGFLRFKFDQGFPVVEKYDSNICYPEFDSFGNLEKLEIKYVYEDHEDKDAHGNPKMKWYKLELGKESDILYDNPEFNAHSHEEPPFQVVSKADHLLGYIQGEWFKTCDDPDQPDGYNIIGDSKGFFDALNYSLSQSDQAVKYNQEPQLILNGMTEDEMGDLIKSSMNAWNLGRDGSAQYLDNPMSGVETASKLRDQWRQNIGDITRVLLLDPEKIVGSAQSAKAMEILHGPMLDLIDELRPFIEKPLIQFIQKLVITAITLNSQGVQIVGVNFPAGYAPITLDLETSWPEVFPMTMNDLQQKISVAAQATQANLISRFTATKWIAKHFDIEDIEAEVNEINTQPQLGGFGFF